MILEKEYINSTCQMQSSTNAMLGIAKISNVGENFIILTSDKEDLPPFSFLSLVKLTVKHPKVGYKVLVGSVSESTAEQVRVSSLVVFTNDERRGYFRLHQLRATTIYICTEVSQAVAAKAGYIGINVPVIEQYAAMVKNMSLSGVLIHSSAQLRMGQRVVVELETKKGMELFQISVRRRNENSEDGSYDYGCIIHETNNAKMDELCRLILDRQASIIQKLKR